MKGVMKYVFAAALWCLGSTSAPAGKIVIETRDVEYWIYCNAGATSQAFEVFTDLQKGLSLALALERVNASPSGDVCFSANRLAHTADVGAVVIDGNSVIYLTIIEFYGIEGLQIHMKMKVPVGPDI